MIINASKVVSSYSFMVVMILLGWYVVGSSSFGSSNRQDVRHQNSYCSTYRCLGGRVGIARDGGHTWWFTTTEDETHDTSHTTPHCFS
ncbi:hypothetical protein RchiOBHm_Chr7g0243321 [Rosa chinensis]|uniref:Uncharacterized protein n=1 Tax=Rosa chinensis TaxID=74649 RepID=A0A2P6PIQ4_ROSCH|nr:hypothetical protein RchiOBHm_Chr7g0243321 [Rosa chinensis]